MRPYVNCVLSKPFAPAFYTVAVILLSVSFSLPAHARLSGDGQSVLLVQKTPSQGGTVTPSVDGAHVFKKNETVMLTAVHKPGYHFLYWLGDVSDPTANNTTINLDTPKFVIAVFARDEYEFQEEKDAAMAIPLMSGSGRMVPKRRTSYGTPSAPSGKQENDDSGPEPEFIEIEEEPIPEPGTIMLFGTGASILLMRRKSNQGAKK